MTRPLLTLAALGATLALGACGSSDDPGSASSPQDKAFEGALKFSKCMRDHGIDMPDPQRVGTGGIKLTARGKLNPNDPKMKAAQEACQKYMKVGGGQTMDPARRAWLQEAALKYARCMRQHGVDMPDPQFSKNGGLTMRFGAGSKNGSGGSPGPNPDSPAFKTADKACHSYLGTVEGPSTQREQG